MSRKGSYVIRIEGLGEGVHDFSFELNEQFFVQFEHPEVKTGNVHANVVLEKPPGVNVLHFHLTGTVEVVCDRCLEPFLTGIDTHQRIFLKHGVKTEEVEDDVLMIGDDTHEIVVDQYLFEFIVLALPLKKVHPEDQEGNSGCDPEMISKLNAHLKTTAETDKLEQSDPRWDALKDIFAKNN